MTELEKIEYTKGFVDKLAEGINPIDGTPIAEDDLLNNVRISRCMYYVSDILRCYRAQTVRALALPAFCSRSHRFL